MSIRTLEAKLGDLLVNGGGLSEGAGGWAAEISMSRKTVHGDFVNIDAEDYT